MQKAKLSSYIIVFSVAFILLLPIIITTIYSLTNNWGASILPDDFTLNWYIQLLSDIRFLKAFARSLAICGSTLVISCILLIPATFIIYFYLPGLKKWANLIIILPFAIPPVVGSVGSLQIFAATLIGTPWILIGTYFTITIPFIYRAIANNLISLNLKELIDAANLLGMSTPKAFLKIILPNLKSGIFSASFISLSFLLGEFVFANILVGTRFETLQVYLYNMRNLSGHFTAAGVISYFAFILLLTILAKKTSLKKTLVKG